MNHHAMTARYRRTLMLLALALVVAFSAAYEFATAQTAPKRVLTIDDYARWRSISGAEISGDGRWVTYVLQFTNTVQADAKPVLHRLNLETNQEVEVPPVQRQERDPARLPGRRPWPARLGESQGPDHPVL